MSAPDTVLRLVDNFALHRDSYTSGGYNEESLRSEFLDPFFEALGWDVANRSHTAEAYKDLVREEAIRVGAPDYCFRIGGTPKFFVEAKKPSVNIAGEPAPAFQLRRYAWSARLPLSILSDFEELAVYDCRIPPKPSDPSRTARRDFITFDAYPERWDFIASVFSKDAVLQGAFDRYAESQKGRGVATVDKAFLGEIESFRDSLARNIALRNPGLSVRDLNFSVQRTIDRIIFLRMCEDRGVEPVGRLQSLLSGPDAYQRLLVFFRQADDRYNSGLFHFSTERERPESPDSLTPGLKIDDKTLKDVLRALYYPASPYEFSVLPPDILGNVYEQFLGKVIHLTPSGQARVEEKPEVKKAGGVYYTPKYIVDYIVDNTVGKLLGTPALPVPQPPSAVHLNPKQISKLRILDPACGSGSFLVSAYRKLLNYHRDWYLADGPAKHTKELYQGANGRWFLATSEKKRILLNNIFGVDIDPQAVEVTKLNLLLCTLENENQSSLRQLNLIHERALPDLGANIKCGNSLIAPDFYKQNQLDLFDDETRYRINAFDWPAEFPSIMKSGGFDAVIGNPPYVRMEEFKELKAYLQGHYVCHDERSDLYAYFIERSHKILRDGGHFGMIVSNKFLRANYGAPLRDFLRNSATVERVVDLAGLPVFLGATVRTIVLVTQKQSGQLSPVIYSPPPQVDLFATLLVGSTSLNDLVSKSAYQVPAASLANKSWSFAEPGAESLLQRLAETCQPLSEYCEGLICMGVKSGCTEAFVVDKKQRTAILRENREAKEIIKPLLNGRDIRRYQLDPSDAFLLYTHHGIDMSRYPAVLEHLAPFKPTLQNRATKQKWYELQQPQLNFAQFMDRPKIVFPDIATEPRFALDAVGFYGTNTTYFIPCVDLFLLGLLNCALANFYFQKTCAGLEGKKETYLRFFGQYMEGFPVPALDLSKKSDKARHDRMVQLVERMLDLHKRLPAANSPHDQELLKREISSTDSSIDSLVYELYSLTPDEIAIVEEEK